MKSIKNTLIHWSLMAVSFFLTLWLIFMVYAGFTSLTPVWTWSGLTANAWNQMITNLNDLDWRVTSLNSTVTSLSIIPKWAVIAYNWTVCPSWWSEANWVNVPTWTSWSVTLNLRWEFIRWLDNWRWVDVSRVFGSLQSEDFKAHKHTEAYSSQVNGWANYAGAWGTSGVTSTPYSLSQTTAAVGPNQYVSTTWWTETRPRNVALLYCVKN
ncbi:MAG: tail collar protein [uncultured bacterium (gcode 4)]|uniref:Tail collar protein n=1 Tax=uncultured bacterium (gcode 4) TaxID=1234023 RepID=K2AWV9_9BACT|nr:MAG: tail collar protein [uncultured bacterium (gcode 4)]